MTLLSILCASFVIALVQRYFAIRIWGDPVFRRGFTGDASVHFAIIRHLLNAPRSRFIKNYLISPEPMSYPILFHRFSTLISPHLLARKQWRPNMILHLLFVVFLSTTTWLITDASLIATSLVLIVYFLGPSNWIFHGPGIAYLGLSPRYMARLLCAGTYSSFVFGVILNEIWLLLVGMGLAALAILSAQFARQALFFCVPLLSLVLMDVRPVMLLALALILAAIAGRRHLWDGLRHTALRWRLYRTRTKQSAHVRRVMLGFFRWNMQGRSFWKAVVYNLLQKEPTRSLFWTPELLLIVFMLATSPFEHAQLFGFALLPPVILYLLTLTERFNHLGEAYRYIEYNLSFMIPICVGLAFVDDVLHWLALTGFFTLSVSHVAARYGHRIYLLYHQKRSHDEITQFISQTGIENSAVIFPVSMRLGADLIARRAEWKTFWWQPEIISEQIYDEYIEEYPFLKKDWRPPCSAPWRDPYHL